MRSFFWLVPAAIPLVAITFSDLSAQELPSRLWANASVGYGAIACRGCNSDDGGTSLSMSGGYTPSPRFMVGGAFTYWVQSNETNARINAKVFSSVARFYPAALRFFLHGGLGVAVTHSKFEATGESIARYVDLTTMAGAGYDL